MRGCGGYGQQEQGSVRPAAVILPPCHLLGIGCEVAPADMVVLSDLGTAQAGEEAFRLIGAGAVIRERDAVIDKFL